MPDEIERECPVCGTRKLLRFFRRWRGSKRVLHATCNACDEVPLGAMRPAQRLAALTSGRANVSPAALDRLAQRDLLVRRTKISSAQRAIHAGTRRIQWEAAMGTRLRSERDWARRNLLALPSDAVGWAAFFEAYINVITDALNRYVAKYNRVGTRTMPTMEEADPRTYVFPETVRTLRGLYSQCQPIRGRRLFRDPWCLEWSEPQ